MTAGKTGKQFGIAAGYLIVFAAVFWLLFYHLDNHLLWGDEAETAVLAKNVLQFGVPKTFDGTNYLILHGTVDETPEHVWIWSPWMQNYIAASSFLIFDETTWAARAPFALAGWFCVVALAALAFKIYRNHWIALAGAILLGGSEIFLLSARQCRYYSISVLTEIFLVYGFYQLLARNKNGIWITAAALILQFYSNYIVAAANLPALLFLTWMFRKNGKAALQQSAVVFGIFFVVILPWLIFAHPFGQTGALGGENFFQKAWNYLLECHFHFLPLWFLLLPLLSLASPRNEKLESLTEWEQLLLFLLPSYFAVALIAPGIYLRYLLPLLPILCLLSAAWIFRYAKWRAVAVALVVIPIFSNCLSFITAYPFRQGHTLRFPIIEYIGGLRTSYADRFSDVLKFFNANARPGDSVISFDPEYPLIFYTSLQVFDGRLFGPPDGKLPDWYLPLPASGVVEQAPVPLPDSWKTNYDLIWIRTHNSILGGSVPDPDIYEYQTSTNWMLFPIYKLKPTVHK